MKTHELAHQLEVFAALLRSLPNSEVEQTYASILRAVGSISDERHKPIERQRKSLPTGIEDRLKQMTPAEVENHLNSESEQYTTSQLVELAERLGISTSKRQGRNALVNLITRFFEASQMHSIIRNARRDEVSQETPPK